MSTIAILGSPNLAFNVNDLDSAPSYQPKADPSSDYGSTNLPQPRYRIGTPIGSPTNTRVPIHQFADPRHSGRQPKNHQPTICPQTCKPHFRFVESVMFANHASSSSLPRTVGHRPCLVVELNSPRPWASYLAILGSSSLPSSLSLSTLPSLCQARLASHHSLG
ncbi:hypothetical protein FH972_001080 [Carpinus fangiana]|uniref:Uncharacterized protein n=1 Tax=Carpinus fangiana TaxID=176857 RepID=A0A5N6QCH6_9ROSI|nr:hypothetical protein FH972_001080 [Carpinus fangiana]